VNPSAYTYTLRTNPLAKHVITLIPILSSTLTNPSKFHLAQLLPFPRTYRSPQPNSFLIVVMYRTPAFPSPNSCSALTLTSAQNPQLNLLLSTKNFNTSPQLLPLARRTLVLNPESSPQPDPNFSPNPSPKPDRTLPLTITLTIPQTITCRFCTSDSQSQPNFHSYFVNLASGADLGSQLSPKLNPDSTLNPKCTYCCTI
jgi:hypothetical protein